MARKYTYQRPRQYRYTRRQPHKGSDLLLLALMLGLCAVAVVVGTLLFR